MTWDNESIAAFYEGLMRPVDEYEDNPLYDPDMYEDDYEFRTEGDE